MTWFSGDRCDISILHLRINSIVLFENPSGHEGAGYQDVGSAHGGEQHRFHVRQNRHGRPRRLLLHRVHLQCLVHIRDPRPVHCVAKQMRIHQFVGEHYRLYCDRELLHRFAVAKVCIASGERRHHGILLDYSHHAAVQVDAALVRFKNSDTDISRVSEGTDIARVFSCVGHCDFRQFGVLCGTYTD